MASPFALDKGSTSPAQYRQLLAENMSRYGGDRDRAVRSANIAAGFGNSTAQRFMHQGGGAPASGGSSSGPAKGAPKPKARPQQQQTLSGPATGAPIPMDRTTGLIEPPSLPGQDQLAGVPPDLMGLPGYGQLQGVPPGLQRQPQNAVGGGVPMNPALSMGSILRSLPPELLGRLASGGPGQPSAGIGLGMQPTLRQPAGVGMSWS